MKKTNIVILAFLFAFLMIILEMLTLSSYEYLTIDKPERIMIHKFVHDNRGLIINDSFSIWYWIESNTISEFISDSMVIYKKANSDLVYFENKDTLIIRRLPSIATDSLINLKSIKQK